MTNAATIQDLKDITLYYQRREDKQIAMFGAADPHTAELAAGYQKLWYAAMEAEEAKSDNREPIKATPYKWRDPSTIPSRKDSLREKNAKIAQLMKENMLLREAIAAARAALGETDDQA